MEVDSVIELKEFYTTQTGQFSESQKTGTEPSGEFQKTQFGKCTACQSTSTDVSADCHSLQTGSSTRCHRNFEDFAQTSQDDELTGSYSDSSYEEEYQDEEEEDVFIWSCGRFIECLVVIMIVAGTSLLIRLALRPPMSKICINL